MSDLLEPHCLAVMQAAHPFVIHTAGSSEKLDWTKGTLLDRMFNNCCQTDQLSGLMFDTFHESFSKTASHS